jgi:hypothetical protein
MKAMTTTTTTCAPRQRKPRARPARSIRLSVPLNAEGKHGLIAITVGKQTDDYFLARIPADWGQGFRLEKLGSDDAYDVNLDDDHGDHFCCCKGHLRHQRCKHVDGIQALIRHGKL